MAENPVLRAEHRRILDLVRARGVDIQSLDDLLKIRLPRDLVPVLIMALPTLTEDAVRAMVVRALTDPAARGLSAQPLIRELARARSEKNERLAWEIGNALAVVADDTVAEELLTAALDPALGIGRQTLAEALARVRKRPEVIAVLSELLLDAQVRGHALRALGKIGAWEARNLIEPFLEHDKKWIRVEAKKALERMGKAEARARS